MINITSYLCDRTVERKYKFGIVRAIFLMDFFVFMGSFKLISMRAAHYAEL